LSERGSFLALDLGGTNFRVLLITVKDKEQAAMKSTIYAISSELMTGPGVKVFSHHYYGYLHCIASNDHRHTWHFSGKLPAA